MFRRVKQVFTVLLSFGESLATKCLHLMMNHAWVDLLLLILI